MRADLFLYVHGYAKSRTSAARLIDGGVFINGEKISKSSQNVPDGAEFYDVKIMNPDRYVSRGGLKLEAALDAFGVSPKWMVCADIGASTGGFTDCLLQRGAEKVYAIDVGHGQLDETLAKDRRVVSLEGVNARTLTRETLGERVSLAVTDVSFISQEKIYDAVKDILDDGGVFISLIKPQFEAGAENVGKGGIVKNRRVHINVINKLIESAGQRALMIKGIIPSPIKGGDGNTEYLAFFEKGGAKEAVDVFACVDAAFKGKK